MGKGAKATRENRTITVDFQDEPTYVQLLSDGKGFVEFVVVFIFALGFQLKHEGMTLLFAGHETTALVLTWAWYLRACHAEVATRVRRDVTAVLAGGAPTMADLPRLGYTRMVLEEALRL